MLLVLVQHIGVFLKEVVGIEQEVIEVHGIAQAATPHIVPVYVAQLRHLCGSITLLTIRMLLVLVGEDEAVLGIADTAAHSGRFVFLLVKSHLAEDGSHQTLAVGGIIDGEVGGKPHHPALSTEYAAEDAVERPHPQGTGLTRIHKLCNALLHLARCLVGKSQGQNVPWLITLLQQVTNLVSKDTRLARPSTGYHQRRSIYAGHSLTLCVIQE